MRIQIKPINKDKSFFMLAKTVSQNRHKEIAYTHGLINSIHQGFYQLAFLHNKQELVLTQNLEF